MITNKIIKLISLALILFIICIFNTGYDLGGYKTEDDSGINLQSLDNNEVVIEPKFYTENFETIICEGNENFINIYTPGQGSVFKGGYSWIDETDTEFNDYGNVGLGLSIEEWEGFLTVTINGQIWVLNYPEEGTGHEWSTNPPRFSELHGYSNYYTIGGMDLTWFNLGTMWGSEENYYCYCYGNTNYYYGHYWWYKPDSFHNLRLITEVVDNDGIHHYLRGIEPLSDPQYYNTTRTLEGIFWAELCYDQESGYYVVINRALADEDIDDSVTTKGVSVWEPPIHYPVNFAGWGTKLIINHAKTDKDKYSLFDEVNLSCEVLDNIWEKVSDAIVTAEIVIPDDTPDDISDNPKEVVQLTESETVEGFYECLEPFTNTAQAGKYYVTFNAEKEDYIDAEPVELSFIVPVKIVLTFDDGPDGEHFLGSGKNTTENIIDDLYSNDIQDGIKATFFVQTHDPEYGGNTTGEALLGMEDEAGHIIGVHTGGEGGHWIWQSHPIRDIQDPYDIDGDSVADGESALESDLIAAILRIKAITGEVPEFVRPPYWWYNQDVLDAYKSDSVKHALGDDYGEGLKMIYRDVQSGDTGESWISSEWWVKQNIKDEIVDCIVESKTYQIIVSFHDTNEDTAEYLSDLGISNSYLGTIVEGVREGFGLETQEQGLEYTQFIISANGVLQVLRLKEVTEVIE